MLNESIILIIKIAETLLSDNNNFVMKRNLNPDLNHFKLLARLMKSPTGAAPCAMELALCQITAAASSHPLTEPRRMRPLA
jgi:hypothetical protein